MKTNIEMDKIKLRLNEQLNEARLSEVRLDTLKRLMECETNKHDWEVFSLRSQSVKLIGCCQSVRQWLSFLGCGQLSVRSSSSEPCYQ